jgi:hypothetical protein
VTKNHCFMSMGQNGAVRSRLLPCPCKKCWDAPHFYSPDCTEQEHNEPPDEHTLTLSIQTDKSDNSLLERERRLQEELDKAGGVTVAALFHDDKEAQKEAMGRLYWMADLQDKTWKQAGKQVIKAYLYDQRIEELPKSQRVVYSKPAAGKCAHQHDKSGKCTKHTAANPCALWHWQHMPVGSVRPPLLSNRLATRRFIPVTGRPLDFVLQAAVASDISDTIAKDEEYYNDTTPAPI